MKAVVRTLATIVCSMLPYGLIPAKPHEFPLTPISTQIVKQEEQSRYNAILSLVGAESHAIQAEKAYSGSALSYLERMEHVDASTKGMMYFMGGRLYAKGEGIGLDILVQSQTHVQEYVQPKPDATQALVITLPEWLMESRWGEWTTLPDQDTQNHDEYLVRMMNALQELKGNDDISVWLVDTPDSYASGSRVFVESGAINGVIFTHYDSGVPVNQDELTQLDFADTIYVAGGKVEIGLRESTQLITERFPDKNIVGVTDLMYSTILATRFTFGYERIAANSREPDQVNAFSEFLSDTISASSLIARK